MMMNSKHPTQEVTTLNTLEPVQTRVLCFKNYKGAEFGSKHVQIKTNEVWLIFDGQFCTRDIIWTNNILFWKKKTKTCFTLIAWATRFLRSCDFCSTMCRWRSRRGHLSAPETERDSGQSASQSSGSAGFNMTVAHSCLRTRTLSRVLFQTSLSRRGSLASVQVRTDTVPQRYLTTLPSPGSWNTELSRLSHGDLYRLSVTEPDRFWGAAAIDKLRWMEPFHRVRDCDLSSGKIKWFVGGKLNVSGENLSWQ